MSKSTRKGFWQRPRWMWGQVEKYLLWDDFCFPRAAGSVNATAAEPGPGTRAVVDTGSKLSIAGGALTVAGGTSVNGDPSTALSAVTRVAGRLGIFRVSLASGRIEGPGFYTSTVPSTGTQEANLRPIGGAIYNSHGAVVGAFSMATAYSIAIGLRAAGYFALVKGGAFTSWTLVWHSVAGATATMYPGFDTWDGVYTVDFLRVPRRLWLPVPIASDGFPTAFGTTDGTGHAETSGIGAGGDGKAWSPTATWSISGAKALNSPTLGAELASGNLVVGTWYSITATQANYFYTGCAIGHTFRATATTALDANNKVKATTLATLFSSVGTPTADVVASVAVVNTAGTQNGLILNLDSATTPANFILAYHDGTNANLVECVAGVYTSKIAAAATYSAGATLVVVRNGTEARLFYANSTVGTLQTMTANTGTLHGVFSTIATNTLDNFVVYARGTGGEYATLDRWIK